MGSIRAAAAAALAGAALALAPAWAQEAPPGVAAGEGAQVADPVVATFDGETVRLSEVIYLYESLSDQLAQFGFEALYPQLLQGTIERKVAARRARAEGIDADPDVAGRMTYWIERVLEEALVAHAIDAMVTEDMVRAAYGDFVASIAGQDEVRASHILVVTEAEAREAVRRLVAGADFAELARELSTGPTGPNGGDLDFFLYNEVVPEFAEVAFTMRVGNFTGEPVASEFGWHVILATDRRPAVPPPFEEVREQLRQSEGSRLVDQIYADMMEGVDVRLFNLDGTPLEAAPVTP